MAKSNSKAAGPHSFPRESRITKKSDFHALRKNARKIVARHWVLFYSRNEGALPRLAITISSRYGNSVKRNQLRRWLRERFRQNKKTFGGVDLHFVAKQKREPVVFRELKQELDEDFQRLLHRFS